MRKCKPVMTVSKLIKLLQKIESKGFGNLPIYFVCDRGYYGPYGTYEEERVFQFYQGCSEYPEACYLEYLKEFQGNPTDEDPVWSTSAIRVHQYMNDSDWEVVSEWEVVKDEQTSEEKA